MELTSENVKKTLDASFFLDGSENVDNAIIVEGITGKYGFDPDRIATQKDNINSMLNELPDSFMQNIGGGMSFLNACVTKDGKQYLQLDKSGDAKGELVPLNAPGIHINKVGGKYIFDTATVKNTPTNILRNLSDVIFDEDGRVSSKVDIKDSAKTKLYRTPNDTEYQDMALSAYNNAESSTSWGRNRKEYSDDKNLSTPTLDIISSNGSIFFRLHVTIID